MSDKQQLIELLNAKSSSKWLDFMDYIHKDLGHILKRGKPKLKDIENSIIGKSGFSSWSELVKAEISNGGLGLKLSTFDSWKRAYSVVQQHKYLRDMELTASFINTLHRETKPDFPSDKEALSRLLANRKRSHTSKLKDTEDRIQELESSNKILLVELEAKEIKVVFSEKLAGKSKLLQNQLSKSEERATQLETQLKSAIERGKKIEKELKNKDEQLQKYVEMSFLDKLKLFFSS